MKIRFGLIYLALLIVGAGYELYKNHFSGVAIVNYLLTGFLYSSIFFIAFYILAKVAIYASSRIMHKDVQSSN